MREIWKLVDVGNRITAVPSPADDVCRKAREWDAYDQLQRCPDQVLWAEAKRMVKGADIRLICKDVLHGLYASHLVHVYAADDGNLICTVAERTGDQWRLVEDGRFRMARGRLLVDMVASDEALRLVREYGDRFKLADLDSLAREIGDAIWYGHLRPDQAAALVTSERRVTA